MLEQNDEPKNMSNVLSYYGGKGAATNLQQGHAFSYTQSTTARKNKPSSTTVSHPSWKIYNGKDPKPVAPPLEKSKIQATMLLLRNSAHRCTSQVMQQQNKISSVTPNMLGKKVHTKKLDKRQAEPPPVKKCFKKVPQVAIIQ